MATIDNKFFDSALKQASGIAGRKNRLLGLSVQLVDRMRKADWKNMQWKVMQEKLLTIGRLSKAYAMGQYRDVDLKTLAIIAAAILYFLNPIDLIPDLLPLGLTDDFAVLVWVYNSVRSEINKFLEWERTRIITP